MANGTGSEEFVTLSTVRPGLKRELAFALKAQSEICGGALGRTRSRKGQSDCPTSPVFSGGRSKRLKKSSDGSKDGRVGKRRLGFGASDPEEEAAGIVEAVEGDESVRVVEDAGDLMSEEEAKSDVVDLEDEPERVPEDSSGKKAVANVSVGGAEEKPCEAVVMVSSGDNEVTDKESNAVKSPGMVDKKETIPSETPSRRFTRSLLNSKVEVSEMSPRKRKAKSKPSGAANADGARLGNMLSLSATIPTKLEMKMSKKVGLRHPFVALKDFLETGLLEGFHVKYSRASKLRRTGLGGVIKGSGILCYCNKCNGNHVVSPTIFELHAGSSCRRPPEYIFLENGSTLRDVMNAVKDSPLEKLEESVKAVLGSSSINKCTLCVNCKVSLTGDEGAKSALLCNICVESGESASPLQVPDTTDILKEEPVTDDQTGGLDTTDQSIQVPNSADESIKTAGTIEGSPEPSLMRKSSASNFKCSSSQTKSHGRVTRKDLGLHKLVFEPDGLPEGTEVAYYSQGKQMLLGYKKGNGIFCRCCQAEVSASQFEAHAGFASRRKPYMSIYTSNGVSLHELSINLAKTRRLSTIENDDLCCTCLDGGDLLCCDTCPRAFHLGCVDMSSLPTGGWNCRYCENNFQIERFVEQNPNALAAGRVKGADAIQQITNRCIRIVETQETDVGGCAICRSHAFTKGGFGPRTVIICDQCEKEYHVGCLRDRKIAFLKQLPKGKWFCCTACDRIHSALESYVGRKYEKLPDSLMDVIRAKLEEKGSMIMSDLDIKWRVLNKMELSEESDRLLAKSVAIFHDRFGSIIESPSGRDLIPAMVSGKSKKDQEFSGMFCIILAVNDEVVSAGLLRIFGEEVAELPLVATSTRCQGQGYFQSLFDCMERLLAEFRVKKLVLPAAEEAESIWTKKFGFDKIAPDELRELRKEYYNMMIFQGTSVLQKSVPGVAVEEGGPQENEVEE